MFSSKKSLGIESTAEEMNTKLLALLKTDWLQPKNFCTPMAYDMLNAYRRDKMGSQYFRKKYPKFVIVNIDDNNEAEGADEVPEERVEANAESVTKVNETCQACLQPTVDPRFQFRLETEAEAYAIKKIIGHRLHRRKMEYKVTWFGYNTTDWLKPSNFCSPAAYDALTKYRCEVLKSRYCPKKYPNFVILGELDESEHSDPVEEEPEDHVAEEPSQEQTESAIVPFEEQENIDEAYQLCDPNVQVPFNEFRSRCLTILFIRKIGTISKLS
uniref:Chromo domain-containing protein n=1 Tax=Panagrellus redivivus TaxID=6233 RepID=A0A7E4V4H6_PANRE